MDTTDIIDLEHPAIELTGFLSICSRNVDNAVDVSIKKFVPSCLPYIFLVNCEEIFILLNIKMASRNVQHI